MRVVFALALLVCTSVCASARYVETHRLPDGRVAVVAEGDLEPRSIGSYSVRIYGARNEQAVTDDFLGGVIRPRNGTIEQVVLADVHGDGSLELIVVIRNVGTGSFLSADAFSCQGDQPVPVRSVEDLAKDADVIAALRESEAEVLSVKQAEGQR